MQLRRIRDILAMLPPLTLIASLPPPPSTPFRTAVPLGNSPLQHKETKKADPLTLMTMCFKEVGAVSSARPILDNLVVGMSKVQYSRPSVNDTLHVGFRLNRCRGSALEVENPPCVERSASHHACEKSCP